MTARPLALAIDTGRGMRRAIGPLVAGLRQVLRLLPRTPVSACALGDQRCHLLQSGDAAELLRRMHVCGLDRSWESALYHFAHLCPPPPRRGVLLLCGNGFVRDAISVHDVRRLGGEAPDHVYTRDILPALRERWSVRTLYFSSGVYDRGASEWGALLGARSVLVVDDPGETASAALSLIRRREPHGQEGRPGRSDPLQG